MSFKKWIEGLTDDPYLNFEYGRKKIRGVNRLLTDHHIVYEEKFNLFLKITCNALTFEAVDEIQKCLNSSKCKNLILDLRNCQGGMLNAAIDLIREFITCDVFLETYNNNRLTQYFSKTYSQLKYDHILVWVGSNTISSAEILAYVLRAKLKNCHLIGSETAGKSYGQTTFFEKNKKCLLSFSSFKWNIPGEEQSLRELIALDNPDTCSTNDLYYQRSVEIAGIARDCLSD